MESDSQKQPSACDNAIRELTHAEMASVSGGGIQLKHDLWLQLKNFSGCRGGRKYANSVYRFIEDDRQKQWWKNTINKSCPNTID